MTKSLIAILLVGAIASSAVAQKRKANVREAAPEGHILLVITNHGRMGDTKKPTGYWMSEVSHAWTQFIDAGYAVTFASPDGDTVPVDPRSFKLDDPDNKRMWSKREVIEQLASTKALADVDALKYDAIYFAGGHGTMWDFPDSEPLQKVTQEIYENGGVVAAVCHGPAALVNVKAADGEPLVKGKTVAAFTDSEEKAAGFQDVVPFLLESKLKELGATVETAPDYQEKVVVDGRLVTGQNPASASGTAKKVLSILKDKKQ